MLSVTKNSNVELKNTTDRRLVLSSHMHVAVSGAIVNSD